MKNTVIIGSGPSAIRCARHLLNKTSFVLIDKGSSVRNHDDQMNASKGFGGAAMFSDGKLAKFPAGTKVWELEKKDVIQNGLNELKSELGRYNVEWGEDSVGILSKKPIGEWYLKDYESIYVPLETRLKMIEDAWKELEEHTLMNCVVYEITKLPDGQYVVWYQKNDDFVTVYHITCTNVVFATGRFSTTFIKHPFPKRFLRVEVGVRLECDADSPLWSLLQNIDTKWIRTGFDHEYRTFCQVLDGEVVQTRFQGVHTHSGRADVPSTGKSNIGFNYRSYNEHDYGSFFQVLNNVRPFNYSFEDMEDNVVLDMQLQLYNKLMRGLRLFLNKMEIQDTSSLRIIGPTIEGVGYYPVLDNNLKVPDERVWCMGDATGIFRGWTASDISGYYVAQNILGNVHYTVRNRIRDDVAYQQTYPPKMIGRSSPALHEIHIFLSPVNPTEDDIERFQNVVRIWNEQHPNAQKPMKACVLALDFRDQGIVTVLQSSRYYASNELPEIVRETHADSAFFCFHEFDVLREKIEASAHGTDGIPMTNDQVFWPLKYFEFHVRVEKENGDEMTSGELNHLIHVSVLLTHQMKVPVPLSFNKLKGTDGKHQRYFNVRTRGKGLNESLLVVQELCDALKEPFKVVKTISEYVWYDSFTSMDKGWIDF